MHMQPTQINIHLLYTEINTLEIFDKNRIEIISCTITMQPQQLYIMNQQSNFTIFQIFGEH